MQPGFLAPSVNSSSWLGRLGLQRRGIEEELRDLAGVRPRCRTGRRDRGAGRDDVDRLLRRPVGMDRRQHRAVGEDLDAAALPPVDELARLLRVRALRQQAVERQLHRHLAVARNARRRIDVEAVQPGSRIFVAGIRLRPAVAKAACIHSSTSTLLPAVSTGKIGTLALLKIWMVIMGGLATVWAAQDCAQPSNRTQQHTAANDRPDCIVMHGSLASRLVVPIRPIAPHEAVEPVQFCRAGKQPGFASNCRPS